jgi:hypothetical protein
MTKNFVIAAIVAVVAFVAIQLFADESHENFGDQLNGDVNLDGQICMDDSIQIIYHLWRDGRELPCPATADVDCDGDIDVTDVIAGLRYIFFGDPIDTIYVTCYPDY